MGVNTLEEMKKCQEEMMEIQRAEESKINL
jgi:hypothetical protein